MAVGPAGILRSRQPDKLAVYPPDFLPGYASAGGADHRTLTGAHLNSPPACEADHVVRREEDAHR